MKTEFGLKPTYLVIESDNCQDDKCHKPLLYGDSVYQDINHKHFCESCGKCVKYARKRQAERTPEREALIKQMGLED